MRDRHGRQAKRGFEVPAVPPLLQTSLEALKLTSWASWFTLVSMRARVTDTLGGFFETRARVARGADAGVVEGGAS
jgi:hypothetical protein